MAGSEINMETQETLKKLALSLIILTMPVQSFAYEAGEITFGSYPYYCEQDEEPIEEPIEWIIISQDKHNDTALIMSKYVLEARHYHNKYANITWEKSYLRKWLNNDFLNKAFSEEEKSRIMESHRDKVYVLSIEEAEDVEYGIPLEAYPTPCADKQLGMKGVSWYWLRTPGENYKRAAFVKEDGKIDVKGEAVADSEKDEIDDTALGVRPVLKIRLKRYLDLSQLKEGDIIDFGRYWNKGADKNKKLPKPIEWKVLTIEGGKALIVSQYGLLMRDEIREFFKDFYFKAFDGNELSFTSKICLVSADEARYLKISDKNIGYYASDYYLPYGPRWYWLRSFGRNKDSVSGKVEDGANQARDTEGTVYMALWLDLEKIAAYNNDIMGKDNQKAYLKKKYEDFENRQFFELKNLEYMTYKDRDRLLFNLCIECDVEKQHDLVWEQEESYPEQFVLRIKGLEVKQYKKIHDKKGRPIKNVVISSTDGKTKIRIDKGYNGGRVYVRQLCTYTEVGTLSCNLALDVFKLKGKTQKEWFKDYSEGKDDFEYNDSCTKNNHNEENIRNIKKIIINGIANYVEE